MLNPLTTSKVFKRLYFTLWILVAIIHGSLLYFVIDINVKDAILDAVVFNIILSVAGYGIWFVVRFSGLDPGNVFNALITHLVSALLLVTVWLGTGYLILKLVLGSEATHTAFIMQTIYWRGAIGILLYALIVLNYYLMIFYQEYQEEKLRKSEMNRLLKESELSMLKAQINPHFIFNSLNSISSLTLTDSKKAHEMVVNLSSFLRYTISPQERKLVILKQELDAIKLYLSIEKIRFGDKLDVLIKCESASGESLIPNMILQPLIENAIKYGVYESTESNQVKISCESSKDALVIDIVNDIEKGGVPKKGKGIGLRNVKSRLKLIYEKEDLMTIERSDTQFSVKLVIPQ